MDERIAYLRKRYLRELKDIAAAKDITHMDIAMKTGLKPSNVNRLLNGRYSCTMDNFLKLVDAIGAEMILLFK